MQPPTGHKNGVVRLINRVSDTKMTTGALLWTRKSDLSWLVVRWGFILLFCLKNNSKEIQIFREQRITFIQRRKKHLYLEVIGMSIESKTF